MADVDHPKTHIENQEDADLPRTQPESPKHEGIDPLTEGDTMYPAEDTKAESEKLAKKEAKTSYDDTNPYANQVVNNGSSDVDHTQTDDDGVGSLTDRDDPAKVTTQKTAPKKADGKVQPQTATPAKTNDSDVAKGSTEPASK